MAFLGLVVALIALYLAVRLQREVDELRRAISRPAPPARPLAAPDGQTPTVAATRQERHLPAPASAMRTSAAPLAGAGHPGAAVLPEGAPEETTIERRIGERLLLYAGMLVLLLGVAFFLRYSFERNWMSPVVRVLMGGAGGAALLGAGRVLARRGFRPYGLFLSGGGVAALFLSVYAAFAFYDLIGQLPAFALLAAIAALAALLADREASLPLALMAVCGGFATPFLVGGEGDAQVVLFSYDALLIAATMYLAHRRGWPWLNLASFVFTVATVTAWAGAYYQDRGLQYLRTELFLTLYCGMFAAILRDNARSADPHARLVSVILWGAPVLYHVASIALLHPHGAAFLVYLLLVSVAFVVAAGETSSTLLRFIGWAAVTLPLVTWIDGYADDGLVTGAVVTSIGTWLTFLLASLRIVRRGEPLRGWDVALVHAAALGVYAALYLALDESQPPRVLAAIGLLLAALHGALWSWLRPAGTVALHWLAAAAVLVVISTAVGLEGHWIVAMWAAEAASLVWLGVRAGREWFRMAGLAVFGIAVLLWLQTPPPDDMTAVFLHARALAGVVIVGCLYLAGWWLREGVVAEPRAALERAGVLVGASAVTVVLVSLEIDTYWAGRPGPATDAELSRQLMFSAWWAAYAGLLTAVGMRYRYPPVRYFAIGLFALTILKVFLVDVQRLEGIYRVIAFLVVGGILLLVSFLYQRSREETDQRAA